MLCSHKQFLFVNKLKFYFSGRNISRKEKEEYTDRKSEMCNVSIQKRRLKRKHRRRQAGVEVQDEIKRGRENISLYTQ